MFGAVFSEASKSHHTLISSKKILFPFLCPKPKFHGVSRSPIRVEGTPRERFPFAFSFRIPPSLWICCARKRHGADVLCNWRKLHPNYKTSAEVSLRSQPVFLPATGRLIDCTKVGNVVSVLWHLYTVLLVVSKFPVISKELILNGLEILTELALFEKERIPQEK